MQIDSILVKGAGSLAEVVTAVEHAVSGTAEEFGNGYRLRLPGGLDTVRVFRAEYVDEPGLPLARYDFVVDIVDADKPQRLERADKIYKQLVERTSWDTLWLTGNGQIIANQRSALVA